MPNTRRYLVSAYMQKGVHTLSKESTFHEALRKMVDEKTNGLVVVDDNKKVVGILSCWDLISYVVPDYLEHERNIASFEAGNVFEDRLRVVADHPVKKFMTANVVSVNEHHTIMEAAALLSENKIRQLPVLDDHDVLVGYINRTDIKRAMADVLH